VVHSGLAYAAPSYPMSLFPLTWEVDIMLPLNSSESVGLAVKWTNFGEA